MLPIKHSLLIVLGLLLTAGDAGLRAQADPEPPPDSISIADPAADSGRIEGVLANDSLPVEVDASITDTVVLDPVMYHLGPDSVLIGAFAPDESDTARRVSPTTALFRSVLFPGWGQYSNRKYIKAGFIFAVESYFIYLAIKDGADAADWRDKWKAVPDDQSALKEEYFNTYADFRDRRNTNIWYTALTVFLSMFDAYVDAHLDRFPDRVTKPEEISFEITPGSETRATISYRF